MSRIPRNPDSNLVATRNSRSPRPTFAISEAVLTASERLLRSPRLNGRETIVYWAGLKREDVWLVTTVIKPKAVRTRGSFATSASDNGDVIQFLSDAGLSLLGQVHTHPGDFVDHSFGDDEEAFMPKENLLSLVVPNFGREGMRPLARCGVHRFEGGKFRRLGDSELETNVCVVPLSRNLARGHSW